MSNTFERMQEQQTNIENAQAELETARSQEYQTNAALLEAEAAEGLLSDGTRARRWMENHIITLAHEQDEERTLIAQILETIIELEHELNWG